MRRLSPLVLPLLALLSPLLFPQAALAQPTQQWHRHTLSLTGPAASERGTTNPFLDYRMLVTFTHPGSSVVRVVPGYFAADGDAAETGATAGSVWRAHLSPGRLGTWNYAVSFRSGPGVALSTSPTAGSPVAGIDGASGSFQVIASDKTGRDHRAPDFGRLGYVGEPFLRFASGRYFLKAGADSPENLLAYDDFDNTPNTGNRRKSWTPHVADWRPGDPTWRGGRGKGLIGAVNYMANKGMNVMSFLTYSYNGDDKNVFPHVDPADPVRFDCSKLDQWEIVFTHMDRRGIYLHFKTQETENDQDLDGGALGTERKLYYRELIARFGHHLALNWNLGEENTNTDAQRKAFAQYFFDTDPYRHHVVIHTYPGQKNQVYTPLLGTASKLTGVSLQSNPASVFSDTLRWRTLSANAGRPWVAANDEQGNASTGIKPDRDDARHDGVRHQVLWGNLMAGGAGIESYFGYQFAHSDLTCQDFRSRDIWWDQCRHALEFFDGQQVPFWAMSNANARTSSGWCLAGARHYVVYLPTGGTATLDLSAETGVFEVRWFDPRLGGGLQKGSVETVSGGGSRTLGTAPIPGARDWVVLVRPAGTVARVGTFGRSCAGTDALLPTLRAPQPPRLGSSQFDLRVGAARKRSTAVLYAGATPVQVPLSGGCQLHVDPVLVAFGGTTSAQGQATFALPIPNTPSLAGVEVVFTAAVTDPNGAFLGQLAITHGLRVLVGI